RSRLSDRLSDRIKRARCVLRARVLAMEHFYFRWSGGVGGQNCAASSHRGAHQILWEFDRYVSIFAALNLGRMSRPKTCLVAQSDEVLTPLVRQKRSFSVSNPTNNLTWIC